jgi:hypothetical protein
VVVEGAQKRLDIVYWWFFNYNQGKTVAGTSWGNHVSDWEHVKVKLDGVDFANPQNEVVVGVMYDHHGEQDNFKPGDGNTEFSGRQVLVHLANSDHEATRKPVSITAAGYARPLQGERVPFDQRQGRGGIYLWNGSLSPAPAGVLELQDPAWLRYRGRWGNQQRGDARTGGKTGIGARGTIPTRQYAPPTP